MNKIKDIFVSVVAVLSSDSVELAETLEAIHRILSENYAHFEILVVDPEGGVSRETKIAEILKVVPGIRYLKIFTAYSDGVLLAAGLENAIGDIIVASDILLLTEKNIVNSVAKCCEGNDVVCGVSSKHRPVLYTVFSGVFKACFGKMISYNLPKHDTFFRCISRRILNAAMAARHFHQFVFLRLANAGATQVEMPLEECGPALRKYMWRGSFGRAVSLIVFNTVKPLRIANMVALLSSGLAVAFAAYTILVKFLKSSVIEGWPTLMLFLALMFFILFVILALIGEYLVRVVIDRSEFRPYNVVFEKHSSVMLNLAELNIRSDSVSDTINLTQTGRDR